MDRNILLVSEQDQKAYLPYKYEDIEYIYKTYNKEFSSIQDVIKNFTFFHYLVLKMLLYPDLGKHLIL